MNCLINLQPHPLTLKISLVLQQCRIDLLFGFQQIASFEVIDGSFIVSSSQAGAIDRA